MSQDELAVVAAVMKVARPVLLSVFEPRSCIASTRIGIDVLAYFGITALPISLFMVVHNAEAVQLFSDGYTNEEVQAIYNTDGHLPTSVGGPWSIGIGGEGGDGWAGHLMVGLPQYRLLIDLSADQANRTHKNIIIDEPLAFTIESADWWMGKEPFSTVMENDDGGRLGFVLNRSLADPDGYKRSLNWRRASSKHQGRVFEQVTGQIIRLVKDELNPEQETA